MINGNACFAYFNKIWGIPGVTDRLWSIGDIVNVLEAWEAVGAEA
jgi:hypothetical protein